MGKTVILEHPLIQHKISLLRDERTGTRDFRVLVSEIAMLMGFEALRDLPTKLVEVKTPITTAKVPVLAGKKLAVVPILRAGLGMVDGARELVPAAKVGHIGLYRDPETLKPVEYYCKLPPDINDREVIVLDPMLATGGSSVDGILSLVPSAKIGHIGIYRDEVTHEPHDYFCKLPKGIDNRLVILPDPMLATGGSAIAAVDFIKAKGCNHIKFMCIIAAPEGLKALQAKHPDIDIYVGCLDDHLNENAYIVPGLGDAGDRIFGTK